VSAGWRQVAARAASVLLRYPDEAVLDAVPLVKAALPDLPAGPAGKLALVAAHRSGADPQLLRTEYVELFDFRRRSCLHLTYYTCGDTRRRGEALASLAGVYRHAGLELLGGELPDFLPAVLDLAALDDSGWDLLRDNRVGLDLLVASLTQQKTVYRHAAAAVLDLVGPARPADLAAAADLARTGPPAERVGLQPFGLASGSSR
jgi:nitrate reductase delta subunit